jgi:membrane protein DedA with SNARE-associated domain/membrane-associated phospholipid phosphatase
MTIIEMIRNLPLPVLNHWGYWIIFIAAMLEATPLFGIVIPGQTIVLLGGFFVRLGVLEPGGAITAATMGAIIGDFTGYLLGRHYGFSFIKKYGRYFFIKKEDFEKIQVLINEHAGKTLIIGRFNSLTRAFAPFAAGSSHVSFLKFLFYNILGGVSWGVCFVVLGIIFGESYKVASRYVGEFIVIAIAVSVLLIYLYRFVNKRKHIFTKYHLYALVFNISSLYLFSKMIEDVTDKEWVTQLDVLINSKMESAWNPSLTNIMLFITQITDPPHLIMLSAVLLGVLVIRKKWYYSLLLFFSMMFGTLSGLLVKFIIQRPRPENTFVMAEGPSFPSGHAVIAIIFFSLLLYVFKDDIKNRLLRYIFIIVNIILFILVGFSRVYLNVHWFSDILAGFSLGLFWLTLLILLFKIISGAVRRTDVSFVRIKKDLKNYMALAKKLKADPSVPKVSKFLLGTAIRRANRVNLAAFLIFLAMIFVPKAVCDEYYTQILNNRNYSNLPNVSDEGGSNNEK